MAETTTSADSDNTDAKTTAKQSGGKPATAKNAPGTAATAAGDDGTPKILATTGLTTSFGPVVVGDGDDAPTYTITRQGVEVAGEHVAAVREAARVNHIKLTSRKVPEAS